MPGHQRHQPPDRGGESRHAAHPGQPGHSVLPPLQLLRPCAVGISIPSAFLFEGYLSRYGLESWARERYQAMAHTASECIACGQCETRCPYHLPIRDMMKRTAEKFGF